MLHKPSVDIQIIVWYLLFQFLSRFKELLGKCGFPHIFSHFLPVCADNTTRKSNIFTAHLAFSNWELLAACSIWNTDDMEQASVYQCETLVLLATSGLAFTCTSAAGRMQFTPVWLNCHGSPEVPWKCNFCDVSDIVSHLFLFFFLSSKNFVQDLKSNVVDLQVNLRQVALQKETWAAGKWQAFHLLQLLRLFKLIETHRESYGSISLNILTKLSDEMRDLNSNLSSNNARWLCQIRHPNILERAYRLCSSITNKI